MMDEQLAAIEARALALLDTPEKEWGEYMLTLAAEIHLLRVHVDRLESN